MQSHTKLIFFIVVVIVAHYLMSSFSASKEYRKFGDRVQEIVNDRAAQLNAEKSIEDSIRTAASKYNALLSEDAIKVRCTRTPVDTVGTLYIICRADVSYTRKITFYKTKTFNVSRVNRSF